MCYPLPIFHKHRRQVSILEKCKGEFLGICKRENITLKYIATLSNMCVYEYCDKKDRQIIMMYIVKEAYEVYIGY